MTSQDREKTANDTFPYRFVAEDGIYEGLTFIYQADGIVISYETGTPDHYFWTGPPSAPFEQRESARYPMTAEKLARFEAVPLRVPVTIDGDRS